ncbi:hypothetical protein [Dactylosporangium sp. CA-139066]|uniref:hypothetical protein n=1 Tax=Dactylosporangium sp. CA-139066 TaxID=3239930 RepID=UPI003D8E8930
MSVDAPDLDIAEMWRAYCHRRFPTRLRGAEVGGIDVVLLDADTAGCVSAWLANGGQLDAARLRILTSCVTNVAAALTVFADGEERYYLEQLHILAAATARKCRPLEATAGHEAAR